MAFHSTLAVHEQQHFKLSFRNSLTKNSCEINLHKVRDIGHIQLTEVSNSIPFFFSFINNSIGETQQFFMIEKIEFSHIAEDRIKRSNRNSFFIERMARVDHY